MKWTYYENVKSALRENENRGYIKLHDTTRFVRDSYGEGQGDKVGGSLRNSARTRYMCSMIEMGKCAGLIRLFPVGNLRQSRRSF